MNRRDRIAWNEVQRQLTSANQQLAALTRENETLWGDKLTAQRTQIDLDQCNALLRKIVESQAQSLLRKDEDIARWKSVAQQRVRADELPTLRIAS